MREGGGRYGREKKEERKLDKLSFFLWKVGGDWDGRRCGKVVVGMGEKRKKKESWSDFLSSCGRWGRDWDGGRCGKVMDGMGGKKKEERKSISTFFLLYGYGR